MINDVSKKSWVTTFSIFFVILYTMFFLSACKGGLCSATQSSLTDADSDCVGDGSDNCALIYNPVQFDGDDDGVGFECDSDDTDDGVAMLILSDPLDYLGEDSSILLDMSVASEHLIDLERTDGVYFILSAEGNFLGAVISDELNDLSILNHTELFGDPSSEISILNSLSVYGGENNNFSVFSYDAQNPPKLYFRKNNSVHDEFVAYLTINPTLNPAIDPCEVLSFLGLSSEFCE